MGLEEYAPFLVGLGPYVLLLPLTFMVAYLYVTRTEPRSKGSGFEPKDRDGLVFLDKAEQNQASGNGEDEHPMEHGDNTPHIPYTTQRYPHEQMIERSKAFYQEMNKRRSCRFFSSEPVPLEVVKNIIHTAGKGTVIIVLLLLLWWWWWWWWWC